MRRLWRWLWLQESAELLLVTAQGYAKRTPLSEFPVQGRGGQGVFALDVSKSASTGPVVGAVTVMGDQEVVFSTVTGSALPVRAGDVPRLDRGSWGRLVTKSGRGAVVAVGNDRVAAVMVPQVAAKPGSEPAKAPARKRESSPARVSAAVPPDNSVTSPDPQERAVRSRRAKSAPDQGTVLKSDSAQDKPAASKQAARRSRSKAEPEPPPTEAKAGTKKDTGLLKSRAAAQPEAPSETKPVVTKERARGARSRSKSEPQPPESAPAAAKGAKNGARSTSKPTEAPVEQQPAAEAPKDTSRRTRRPVVTQTPRRTRGEKAG